MQFTIYVVNIATTNMRNENKSTPLHMFFLETCFKQNHSTNLKDKTVCLMYDF